MSNQATELSVDAQNFNWLVARFAKETGGVIAAIAVSSDGLLIANSAKLDRANADRLSAICAAMLSLAQGVSDCHPLGEPDKVVIELTEGYLLVCTIGAGCALGVLVSPQASLGAVAYEMTVFANSSGPTLTPQLIEELKLTVGF